MYKAYASLSIVSFPGHYSECENLWKRDKIVAVVDATGQVNMTLNTSVIWATMWLRPKLMLMTTISCFFHWQKSEGNNWAGLSPSKSNSANFCPRCLFFSFRCMFCFVFRSLVDFKAFVFVCLHPQSPLSSLSFSLIKKKTTIIYVCLCNLQPGLSLSLSPNSLLI